MAIVPEGKPVPGRPKPGRATIQLLDRVVAQDAGALDELMALYWVPLVQYATRIVRNTDVAEDLVQDVFLRLWERGTPSLTTTSPHAYLYGMTRNAALQALRKSGMRTRAATVLRFQRKEKPTPLELAAQAEMRGAIEKAVNALPPRRREAFVLVRFHGLTTAEAADVLQIAPQTVANQISSALTELRRVLQRFHS